MLSTIVREILVVLAHKFALSHSHKRTLLNKNGVAVLIQRRIPLIWLKHLSVSKVETNLIFSELTRLLTFQRTWRQNTSLIPSVQTVH